MWVSRDQWEALVKRVETLETDNKYSHHFDVYESYDGMYLSLNGWRHLSQPQRISVKDVVQRILGKLGMKLKYVKGEPSRVDVCDAAPHASSEEKP